MTIDLLKLFVLLLFVVVALVSALFVVEPTWQGEDELDQAAREPACDDFYILGGSWNRWEKLLFLVLNAVVDGRAQDALFMCVLHENNENRLLLWFFTYLLLLFVVVLLLNMLIAMFSRSFDMMYDSMTIHVQTHFARAVVAWCASAPEPPPLNLLQLPYQIVRLFLALAQPLWRRRLRMRSCTWSKSKARGPARDGEAASPAASTAGLAVMAESSPSVSSAAYANPRELATAAATASAPQTSSVAALDLSAHIDTAKPGGSARAKNGPAAQRFQRQASFGGLGRLLRHTHGTFSGMRLQPAVLWLLHGQGSGPHEEPGDCTDVRSSNRRANACRVLRSLCASPWPTHLTRCPLAPSGR